MRMVARAVSVAGQSLQSKVDARTDKLLLACPCEYPNIVGFVFALGCVLPHHVTGLDAELRVVIDF